MAFIVFEGLDHSGKSTLIQSLLKELEKYQVQVVATREPGGTPLGEQIRKKVLDPYGESVSPETEIMLILASRRDHIEKIILPTLEAGKWLICDRFWPSTFAFQGAGQGLNLDKIKWLHEFVVPKDLEPDLWVLLDMSVSEKERRSQIKGHSSDRFEMKDRQYHQRVREYYLSLAHKTKAPWLVLNALLSPEELTRLTVEELKKRKWLSS